MATHASVVLRTAALTACLLAAGMTLGCSSDAPADTEPPPTGPTTPGPWQLVWSDEFDGPAGSGVDTTLWRHDLGDGCAEGICGWGNGELQTYTDASDNIALTGDGALAITARTAPTGLGCYYGSCRYTSAKITTRGKRNAGPGRVEARIQVPAGQGLWPAFWMLGHTHPATSWPDCGELDIMEFRGSQPARVSSAIHGPGYAGEASFNRTFELASGDFTSAFHTFAVEWDNESVRFFVGDSLHFQTTRSQVNARGTPVFAQPHYVILNVAVGGHFDGNPASDAIFPATMLVDYVRVYQR